MGGIKPTIVKKISKILLEKFPDKFGKDFETNKIILSEMNIIDSKLNRNKVAAYIGKVKSRQAK